MIGNRGVFLTSIPITIQAVETPVKRIEEAVARSVVRQLTREHRTARRPVVVRTTRIRHNLIVRVLVPQPDDRVVLCIQSQMQNRVASLDISTQKRVPVPLLKVDPIRPAHRTSTTRRAVDVQPHKRARIHPVGRRRIRSLVTNRVYRRLKSVERIVKKCSARVIPGPVQSDTRLIRVTQKIQALNVEFLGPIS